MVVITIYNDYQTKWRSKQTVLSFEWVILGHAGNGEIPSSLQWSLKLPLFPQGQVNRLHLFISSLFALGVHYFPEKLWLQDGNQKQTWPNERDGFWYQEFSTINYVPKVKNTSYQKAEKLQNSSYPLNPLLFGWNSVETPYRNSHSLGLNSTLWRRPL